MANFETGTIIDLNYINSSSWCCHPGIYEGPYGPDIYAGPFYGSPVTNGDNPEFSGDIPDGGSSSLPNLNGNEIYTDPQQQGEFLPTLTVEYPRSVNIGVEPRPGSISVNEKVQITDDISVKDTQTYTNDFEKISDKQEITVDVSDRDKITYGRDSYGGSSYKWNHHGESVDTNIWQHHDPFGDSIGITIQFNF